MTEVSTESVRWLLLALLTVIPGLSGVNSSCTVGVTEEVLWVQRREKSHPSEVVRAGFLEEVSHESGLEGGWRWWIRACRGAEGEERWMICAEQVRGAGWELSWGVGGAVSKQIEWLALKGGRIFRLLSKRMPEVGQEPQSSFPFTTSRSYPWEAVDPRSGWQHPPCWQDAPNP